MKEIYIKQYSSSSAHSHWRLAIIRLIFTPQAVGRSLEQLIGLKPRGAVSSCNLTLSCVIYSIGKAVYLFNLEESHPREERVRAGLVLRAHSAQFQLLRYLLQPSLQVLAQLHEVLWRMENKSVGIIKDMKIAENDIGSQFF